MNIQGIDEVTFTVLDNKTIKFHLLLYISVILYNHHQRVNYHDNIITYMIFSVPNWKATGLSDF